MDFRACSSLEAADKGSQVQSAAHDKRRVVATKTPQGLKFGSVLKPKAQRTLRRPLPPPTFLGKA